MSPTHWREFGAIAVNKMAQAQPGEKLLILTDTRTDQKIAEACREAGIAAGIDTRYQVIPYLEPTDTRELEPDAAQAILDADVILGICETMFDEKEAARLARKNGTRITITAPGGMEDFLISGICDVDYDLMLRVAERARELWAGAELCRITSSLGTDIRFGMQGRPVLIGDGMATQPGELDFFPGVSIANAPIEDTIQGTIVIDGNIPPGKLVEEPVICDLDKGVITRIDGGRDAAELEAYFAESGDPVAKHLCHFTLGLNPGAKTTGHVHQDEHVLGAVTFGFGSQDPDFQGTVPPCQVHCDVVLRSPTILLDGTLFCRDNQLNNDLGLGGL
jgi:leucyl aminopeptidase (aminopeptidase T)